VETRDWDTSVYDQCLASKRYVLYFGRFQLHKGVHIFARALPRFLERHPDAHAVFVVATWKRRYPRRWPPLPARNAGCPRRAVMIENLPHRQLYPIIASARLVVLPSLVDNLPNACLEAMGLGTAVIGTTGTSFDELITDGVNGFLVPPNDPEALSEKMMSAWVDPRPREIGEAAKRRMADFAPEKLSPRCWPTIPHVVAIEESSGSLPRTPCHPAIVARHRRLVQLAFGSGGSREPVPRR
jgi:glycosyltransferase involved in cell wall biosynthesis